MKCKLERCDNEVEQPEIGAPRKFCRDEHRIEYWNAHGRPPAQVRHSISSVDEEERTGYCAKCGRRVKVFKINDTYSDGRPRVRWVCQERVNKSPSRKRYNQSEKRKATVRRSLYGLSAESYASLMAKQNGRCAICERPMERPQVDHDHATGRVRGLLCVTCNTGLGKLGDSIERIEHVLAYLRAAA